MSSVIGFGGLAVTVRTLWTLPNIKDTDIITVRNKQRTYRKRTVTFGIMTSVFFAISIGFYFYASSFVRETGNVCEMVQVPHPAAAAMYPFFITTAVALTGFVWFQFRVLRFKRNNRTRSE